MRLFLLIAAITIGSAVLHIGSTQYMTFNRKTEIMFDGNGWGIFFLLLAFGWDAFDSLRKNK
jgi:hypothetical protein